MHIIKAKYWTLNQRILRHTRQLWQTAKTKIQQAKKKKINSEKTLENQLIIS
jgi:TfoX/Sxy family transcriptional regulator of competence genes